MKIQLEKRYVAPKPKAKLFREALVLSKENDLDDITPDTLDVLLQFVVDTFSNQFTLDDLYNHLDSEALIPTIIESIHYVANSMTKENDKKKLMEQL